ncbi:bacterial leucyl aminopeptidase precursor [bacterium BMS3Abin03]|nr:bacterial leucyl aminopeptidase precursor [bacterium BMS3Abin03]
MKKLLLPIILLSLFTQSRVFSQSPIVQSIIDNTNIDSLVYFDRELSGDVQTIINGQPYTIVSRNKNQPSNDKAADYIQQKLEFYGLEVFNQSFSSTGRNVYAVQTGTEFLNQKYIICAHYDDMPSGAIAPGADDNASGTSAVLEAARVLSQYSFPYTIVYALWDEEEQGLIGSAYFAQNAANQGDSILGVINLDMIGWDSDNDNVANIHARSVGNSLDLKDKMVEINTSYGIGLDLLIMNPGSTYSDHASFWSNGFGAILLIEDDNDFNDYYHTTNDKYIYFNQPYYGKMAKLAFATLATYALNLDIKIIHTPVASRDNSDDIAAAADIVTSLTIGTGIQAPRLYYRVNYGTGFSEFFDVVGSTNSVSDTYNFTIPGQPLGTIVQYYIAAQDADSSIIITLPVGGGGFNPPGYIPPEDFFQFYVSPMNIVFADSAANTDNWTITGNWDVTPEKFVSAPFSFTDSPGEDYPNNYNASFEYNGTIDLTNILGATIEFQTQWNIETDWDYGQFQVSTDLGSSWESMKGKYTNAGTGSFQPPGEPLYDGVQPTWVKESIDISEFIGKQITFRYLIMSDSYITKDGWYVDDINVTLYEAVLVNAENSTLQIKTYSLEQNYPNPFNPGTKIVFRIPESEFVTLKVYDILGNEIVCLLNEQKEAGKYEVVFNAANLPSGVYFYTLKAGNFVSTKKMLLMK